MDQSLSSEAARTALEAPSDHALRVPYYCEENVWRLAHRHSSSNCHVVFLSNARQCVAMHHQLVREDGPCFWDYHVILIKTENDETVVLDMDSCLSYPCPLTEYLRKSFVQEGDYAPLFRVVEATLYLKHFSSDRSHMYNKDTGEWNAPPPEYACIQSGPSNLRDYIIMSDSREGLVNENTKNSFGVTMSLAELKEFFLAIPY